MSKKWNPMRKLTGGLALASLAAGGCGQSPEEQFEDAVEDACRQFATCYGYGSVDTQECVDDYLAAGRSLSDDCLEGYAIIIDCYVDATGPTCRDLSDAELFAACGSEIEAAIDLCPAIAGDI